MEPAKCMICDKPMIDWLEVCGKLCVCQHCASTITLSDLVGIGFAELKPDTFQMDGETLVTKDMPEDELDVNAARERFKKAYINSKQQTASVYGETGFYPADGTDISNFHDESYDWVIDNIVQRIKDMGFATEAAFNAHCNALIEGGYTSNNSYALLLFERYNEQTVCDEIGTHYNALEGQTPDEVINAMSEAESLVTKVPTVNPVESDIPSDYVEEPNGGIIFEDGHISVAPDSNLN